MATSGQEQTAPAREKAGRRLVAALLLLVALLLVLVGALLWQRFYRADPKLEPNATVGMMPGKTAEQIEAELNQQISEGMIAFTINSAPTFWGGKGNIWFENPASNGKYTRLELCLDEADPYAETLGGELVLCKTGLLKPGSYMETIELEAALPAGSYSCTARIFAYRTDGETYLGEVQAGLVLTVQG